MKIEQGQGQAVAQRREAMPVVAAFIDWCRAAYGADMVDQQLAIARQAQRKHAQVLAEQGRAAAERWRKANAHRCTFIATEGGRTIGLASPWGATPPIGTPTATGHAGNSTPALAPVAGLGKSERNSEHGVRK
jgi:hypothetical protein